MRFRLMRAACAVTLLLAAAALGAVLGQFRNGPHHPSDATANADSVLAGRVAGRCLAPNAAGDGDSAGMVWVEGGTFTMGDDATFPEEAPARQVSVDGFWMDRTEVTNAQFAAFVAATRYVTRAEREGSSAVFRPPLSPEQLRTPASWWKARRGADWRHPEGPGSSIADRARHPVVHVAFEDALAYAQWLGHTLPTEAQFERAAQGASRRTRAGAQGSNTWQGSFPVLDTGADGHAGTAPVGCFEPTGGGLHDLIGNVWEWTHSAYFPRHDIEDVDHPHGFDPAQPDERHVNVVKGGSWLCSADYCMRYRPAARIGQSATLPASHIGFRTVSGGSRE